MGAVEAGPRKPTNPETDAYKKYLENRNKGAPPAPTKDKTPNERQWDRFREEHSEGLDDYLDYRYRGGAPEKENDRIREERARWDQFEIDKFGGSLERGGGTGEFGSYTLDDLLIKASDKQWSDRRGDLFIDPNKDKKRGGGKKPGGRGSGGKTGGPGNPNTGGAGGGAGDANL